MGEQRDAGGGGEGAGDEADAVGVFRQRPLADALVAPAPVGPVVAVLTAALAEVEGGGLVAAEKGGQAVGVVPVGVGEDGEVGAGEIDAQGGGVAGEVLPAAGVQ